MRSKASTSRLAVKRWREFQAAPFRGSKGLSGLANGVVIDGHALPASQSVMVAKNAGLTRLHSRRAHGVPFACHRLHFQRLVFPWTDLSLGNCSYLDTCRHMKTCRFVHYQLDDQEHPDPMSEIVAARPTKQAVPSYLQVNLSTFPQASPPRGVPSSILAPPHHAASFPQFLLQFS
jgi:hypothetical protein